MVRIKLRSISTRWWNFKYFLEFSPRTLGKMNPFWLMFFNWAETTKKSTLSDRMFVIDQGLLMSELYRFSEQDKFGIDARSGKLWGVPCGQAGCCFSYFFWGCVAFFLGGQRAQTPLVRMNEWQRGRLQYVSCDFLSYIFYMQRHSLNWCLSWMSHLVRDGQNHERSILVMFEDFFSDPLEPTATHHWELLVDSILTLGPQNHEKWRV